MKRFYGSAAILAVGLAGCGDTGTADVDTNVVTPGDMNEMNVAAGAPTMPTRATATLQTAEGRQVGTATAMPGEGGIRVSLQVEGLPPGPHGVHVHTVGRCDAPDFQSAEGHWNPTDQSHGLEDPDGQHAGDMPNLTVGEDGRGTLDYTLQGGTFEAMLEGDGSAFIVHAGRDDQRTDPAGDSGPRLACGVFTPA